jgi:hypothetical protein
LLREGVAVGRFGGRAGHCSYSRGCGRVSDSQTALRPCFRWCAQNPERRQDRAKNWQDRESGRRGERSTVEEARQVRLAALIFSVKTKTTYREK